MKIYNKEELLDKKFHRLTVKDLKDFIAKHDISDDAVILVERVEDRYYDGIDISGISGCQYTKDGIYPEGSKADGWKVYLNKGFHYYNMLEWNERIQGEFLNEEEYPEMANNIKTGKVKPFTETQLTESMDQFHPAFSCAKETDEKDLLFIHLHY